jgi:hypothetical protein
MRSQPGPNWKRVWTPVGPPCTSRRRFNVPLLDQVCTISCRFSLSFRPGVGQAAPSTYGRCASNHYTIMMWCA